MFASQGTARRTTAALMLCALPTAAQGTVWTVDDDGGADFLDLPAAISAAGEGDTLLVSAGSYSAFDIDGKSLTLLGDDGPAPTVDGTFSVRNLASDQRVVVRHLDTGTPLAEGAVLLDNAGSVWIEDCVLRAQKGFNHPQPGQHIHGYRGAEITNCADVVFLRSHLTGGEGAGLCDFLTDFLGNGGRGLSLSLSKVTLYDSTVQGGRGGSDICSNVIQGKAGPPGIYMSSGSTFLSGTTVIGGPGGYGGDNYLWGGCANGGPGGPGFSLVGGELHHRDTQFIGGAGGGGAAYYGCQNGPDGVGLFDGQGVEFPFAGNSKGFAAPSPLRAGTSQRASAFGLEGDLALMLLSSTPTHDLNQALGGVLLTTPSVVLPLGTLPATGQLDAPLSFAGLPPAVESRTLYSQGVFLETGGALVLGSGSALTLLGAGF